MANCPSCGGLMSFSIPDQKLHCQSCNKFHDPYEIDRVNNAEDQGDSYGINVFTCPNCGGELLSTDHDLSGNCSFCGSPVVFDTRMRNERRPNYIIPFQKTKEDCKEAYVKAIEKCRFIPKELTDTQYIDGFRGIYVPYWLYEVDQDGEPFDVKGYHTYTIGDYDYKETYQLKGKIDNTYYEIPHDASSVLSDDISEMVEPYLLCKLNHKEGNSKAIKDFTPSYLSGFYGETADVDQEVYHEYAMSVAEDHAKKYMDEKSPFSKYHISSQLKKEHFNSQVKGTKLALFPIWFLSYRKNNRVAYAAVNGQTGRLISDLPIDMKKFFTTFSIITVISFLLLNFMTILPRTVTMFSIFISYLITSFCKDDLKKIVERSNDGSKKKKRRISSNFSMTMLTFAVTLVLCGFFKVWIYFDDDMSFMTSVYVYIFLAFLLFVFQAFMTVSMILKMRTVIKEKYYGIIFPFLTLAATFYGLTVLFQRPVQDQYYYFATLIVIAVSLICFVGMILNYNRVATRPLPQFKIHQGGDDRA